MVLTNVLLAIASELISSRELVREPEPDLVMSDREQVSAYIAGASCDEMAAAYTFHAARVSQVIQHCRSILDLGCGPATQLEYVARLHPKARFTGIDLSSTMLEEAENRRRQLGLENVDFRQDDITELRSVADASVDGVMSCMTLHHLPTLDHLVKMLRSIRRVLRPGGALYLADFGRLKSAESVGHFADLIAKGQPELFRADFEHSLRAAFLSNEVSDLAHQHVSGVRTYTTFGVPLLVIVKTADTALPARTRRELFAMRSSLTSRGRLELDALRWFFSLGGLGGDPF